MDFRLQVRDVWLVLCVEMEETQQCSSEGAFDKVKQRSSPAATGRRASIRKISSNEGWNDEEL